MNPWSVFQIHIPYIEKGFSISFTLGMDENGKQEGKGDGLVCVCVDFVFVLSSMQVSWWYEQNIEQNIRPGMQD